MESSRCREIGGCYARRMRRSAIVAPVVLLAALSAGASQQVPVAPTDLLECRKTYSANGRFCFVERVDSGVPDFGSVPVSTILRFDADGGIIDDEEEPRAKPVGVLYDGKQLIATLPLASGSPRYLVGDSGRFVVALNEDERSPVTIEAADGSGTRALRAEELFSPSDRYALLTLQFQLNRARLEVRDGRDLLLLPVPRTLATNPPLGEVVVDLESGRRISPDRDLFPVLRAWTSPSDGAISPERRNSWQPPHCSAAPSREPLRISSKQLYSRARQRITALYPEYARRARIEGVVWLEVTIDEEGRVVCTHVNGLPFGITEAAEKAMRQWRFEPYRVDGKAVPVTSDLAWHFAHVSEEEWSEIGAADRP